MLKHTLSVIRQVRNFFSSPTTITLLRNGISLLILSSMGTGLISTSPHKVIFSEGRGDMVTEKGSKSKWEGGWKNKREIEKVKRKWRVWGESPVFKKWIIYAHSKCSNEVTAVLSPLILQVNCKNPSYSEVHKIKHKLKDWWPTFNSGMQSINMHSKCYKQLDAWSMYVFQCCNTSYRGLLSILLCTCVSYKRSVKLSTTARVVDKEGTVPLSLTLSVFAIK